MGTALAARLGLGLLLLALLLPTQVSPDGGTGAREPSSALPSHPEPSSAPRCPAAAVSPQARGAPEGAAAAISLPWVGDRARGAAVGL